MTNITKDRTHVSYSQYTQWRTCPLMYDYNYRQKLAVRDDSIHTLFGTALHELLQWWLQDVVFSKYSLVFAKSIDLTDKWTDKFVEIFSPHVKSNIFTREEAEEFHAQGVEIIQYVQQNVTKLFPTKNIELHSIEYEVKYPVAENVDYIGYIDIITKDTTDDTYVLYDLKSSTKGWHKWAKSDKKKTDQLVLYKKFFSILNDVPLEHINIEYVIMKRILWEGSSFPIPRVSKFTPAHGNTSIKRVWKEFNEFIDLAFDSNGDRIPDNVVATPSENSCRYCPYADGHCDQAFKKEPSGKKKSPATVSLFS